MPTQQEIFQNKQREFNNQWKIDISIDNIEEELREIEPISNDIFDIEIEEDEEEKSLGTYVKIFDHVAETYMYQATNISGKQLHEGVKDFNTEAFLDSFEELMAAKPMPNGALKHQPYDGYDRNWLLSHFNKALKPYNKSVAQVWTDNVINDKVSVAEMRAVTERSYNSLQSDNEAPNALSDNGKAAIQNLIAARDTIANVRAQRSIAWHFAFWNWGDWIRESSYLSRLEKQLVELKDRGFTYDIMVVSIRSYG